MELKNNFGSFDPKGEAEAELKALHMHENHQAMKYFIRFQQLASQVQWGNTALQWQAYNGLAKCIKDDMVHHHKPNTLSSLQKFIQAIDAWYWEWKGEVSWESHISKSSRNKSEPKHDTSKSDNKSSKNSLMKQKNNSGSAQSNTSAPKEPISDLSTILSKDGKLTLQEHQCQLNNNLCLFCGNSGHVAKDCSKASAAKACTAKAEQDKAASNYSSEPKKD